MFTKIVTDCYADPWHNRHGKEYVVRGAAMCRSPKQATIRADQALRGKYRRDPDLGDHSLVLVVEELFKGQVKILDKAD